MIRLCAFAGILCLLLGVLALFAGSLAGLWASDAAAIVFAVGYVIAECIPHVGDKR